MDSSLYTQSCGSIGLCYIGVLDLKKITSSVVLGHANESCGSKLLSIDEENGRSR